MSVEPARLSLSFWRGATFHKHLVLYDEDNQPRDLTNYTGLLEIRDEPQGAVLLSLTTENNRIEMGGTSGTIDLVVDSVTTMNLTWDTGVYDLTITAPAGGDTDALLWGKVTVRGI